MRYRVDELASRCDVSVDTVRFYQTRGLLPPPQREGRVAWYDDEHLERLKRIRSLKEKGFTLSSIRRLLAGDLDAADQALVDALAESLPGSAVRPDEFLTRDELAERTGLSPALLQAIEAEGLLMPVERDGEHRYTADDAAVVAAGLELLKTGLPLSELLSLAREHDEAMRRVAARAVELFLRFVRDPIRASASSETEAAEGLVAAFQRMLPATTELVAHHFRRVLLLEAQARLEGDGLEAEAVAASPEGMTARGREDTEEAWPT